MELPPIVSEQEWQEARDALLVKEKELTHARDAMAAERRRMPRMLVEKEYEFEGPDGRVSLLDLFEGRRQLIIYRFFYEPGVSGWPEKGCPGCSMMADQNAHPAHLNARDTMFAHVSRAPQADIERLKEKMGWDDPLVHRHRRLRQGLRRRRVARHQRLPAGRGSDLPHLLRRRARRRGPRQHVQLPRHHAARAPGGMGGLARGLPAGPAAATWWRRHDEYEPDPPELPLDDETLIAADDARSAAGARRDTARPRRRRPGRGAGAHGRRRRHRAPRRPHLGVVAPARAPGRAGVTTATLDRVFSAVSDPTRRAILARLADSDARVTDLAGDFPISLNSTSKHIRVLEGAGLVRRDVRGREHILSLEAEPLAEAAEWIEHYRRFWSDQLASLDRFVTTREAGKEPK